MVSIYDFIYVDRERIASLYAQMFGGHLLTFKELTGSVSESKAGISGGVPKQEKREFKQLKKMLDLIKGFIETAPILPAFLYKDSEGKLYGGTIKEKFLSEPIPSFYLKHSNKWLSNVAIVGVKEVADDTEALPEGHLSNVTNQIMESLSKMIIPLEAERIIPIAIMRKIGEKQFQ